MSNLAKQWFFATLAMALILVLPGCGGGSHHKTRSIGGTVSGLGGGLSVTLLNNGGDALTVTANGSFVFSTKIKKKSAYAVTVGTQPTGQTCTVANGSGTARKANVTNVSVTCTTNTYAIGGTLSGLGNGLSITLLNNGGNSLPLIANGSFAFTTALASGAAYVVTVGTQPAGQTCTVANGSGAVGSANVTSVSVTCMTNPRYTIGGTLSGLGAGLSVTLLNSGGDALVRNANGSFAFATALASGATYAVTVGTQPAGQTCAVANGSGAVGSANVSNVSVTCTRNTYTVGGTLSGLGSGLSIALLNNGGDSLTLSTDGSFLFAVSIASGATYSVTVGTQPPGQVCTVSNGSGSVGSANVTNVAVVCRDGNLWAWQGGANLVSPSGLYGTKGVAAASNMPGGRKWTASWQDSTGNFWMFGGQGYGSTRATGDLNDLWQYSPTTGLWTWMSGSNVVNSAGVYGVQGVAAAANVPGARESIVSWTDAAGNLWLFGGRIDHGGGAADYYNDLWKYSPATGMWTWVGGANTANSGGVYGVPGTESATNWPGARYGALVWTDGASRTWMFGGYGLDSAGTVLGYLNDLWRYDPSSGRWTWVGGSDTRDATGTYGTQGTPAAANVPGSRAWASAWTDSAGNQWLFGGLTAGAPSSAATLNDLWKHDANSGQWTWVGGSNVGGARGVYGTQGTAAASNVPGARGGSMAWADGSGDLWLFGGAGFDSVGTEIDDLNDLWKYNIATGHWTWVNGSNLVRASSVYGNLGTPAVATQAGARDGGTIWASGNDHAWLFGGAGYDSVGVYSLHGLNDLFEYFP